MKKLKLDELKLKSFVTVPDQEKATLKGGESFGAVCVQQGTWYSCYMYISCDVVNCTPDRVGTITGDLAVTSAGINC